MNAIKVLVMITSLTIEDFASLSVEIKANLLGMLRLNP